MKSTLWIPLAALACTILSGVIAPLGLGFVLISGILVCLIHCDGRWIALYTILGNCLMLLIWLIFILILANDNPSSVPCRKSWVCYGPSRRDATERD